MIDDFLDSTEYDAGFEAGTAGKPCIGKTAEWLSGWADAHDFRSAAASGFSMHIWLKKHSTPKVPRRRLGPMR